MRSVVSIFLLFTAAQGASHSLIRSESRRPLQPPAIEELETDGQDLFDNPFKDVGKSVANIDANGDFLVQTVESHVHQRHVQKPCPRFTEIEMKRMVAPLYDVNAPNAVLDKLFADDMQSDNEILNATTSEKDLVLIAKNALKMTFPNLTIVPVEYLVGSSESCPGSNNILTVRVRITGIPPTNVINSSLTGFVDSVANGAATIANGSSLPPQILSKVRPLLTSFASALTGTMKKGITLGMLDIIEFSADQKIVRLYHLENWPQAYVNFLTDLGGELMKRGSALEGTQNPKKCPSLTSGQIKHLLAPLYDPHASEDTVRKLLADDMKPDNEVVNVGRSPRELILEARRDLKMSFPDLKMRPLEFIIGSSTDCPNSNNMVTVRLRIVGKPPMDVVSAVLDWVTNATVKSLGKIAKALDVPEETSSLVNNVLTNFSSALKGTLQDGINMSTVETIEFSSENKIVRLHHLENWPKLFEVFGEKLAAFGGDDDDDNGDGSSTPVTTAAPRVTPVTTAALQATPVTTTATPAATAASQEKSAPAAPVAKPVGK